MKIYQVDAFANQKFEGNPAAVIPLQEWLSDELMQQIGQENNLSETAFFVPNDGGYGLRWFTPNTEVDLCGHATLASAHVLFQHLNFEGETIAFETRSGRLEVKKEGNAYVMNFPADELKKLDGYAALENALGMDALEIWKGKTDYLVLVENHKAVQAIEPDMRALAQLEARGVIVTAASDIEQYDFVSRFFAPQCDVDEDPVTGSAHTSLTPFWANKLGKEKLSARQISARGGDVACTLRGDRVQLRGQAVTYLVGDLV